jgi:hypothetical protein
MSRFVPYIALFLGSEAIGIALGELFYHLFRQTVPPLVMSNFNSAAAHAGFYMYGAGGGILIFVWSVVVMLLSRVGRRGASETSA